MKDDKNAGCFSVAGGVSGAGRAPFAMKITAGLGSIDDYISYAEAGADELFCGYVPGTWMNIQGRSVPMNRREVMYYNVQIGSESEMEILRSMMDVYKVPVSITLNGLYYLPEQYPCLADYIRHCLQLGFDRFIIADPALLVYLKQEKLDEVCHIHISGEIGEINSGVLETCRDLGADRVIFHRKVSLADMERCIRSDLANHPDHPLEYEAFILNEMCHFHGGFCNSLHCDELCHICHLPYWLGRVSSLSQAEWKKVDDSTQSLVGSDGCGLCALSQLEKIGITHLKIVGRGNYTEAMIRDIKALKEALQKGWTKPKTGCSERCYYR